MSTPFAHTPTLVRAASVAAAAAATFRRGADRRLCGWCAAELPRRHAFPHCSKKCGDAARLFADLGELRALVYERDRGVCSDCGTDTGALRAELAAVPATARGAVCRRVGIPSGQRHGSLWHVHLDGAPRQGRPPLELLRTLCVPCHRRAVAPREGE